MENLMQRIALIFDCFRPTPNWNVWQSQSELTWFSDTILARMCQKSKNFIQIPDTFM